MKDLIGKLVFIQTANQESSIPTSGILGILEGETPEYLKLKDAGVFALLPTPQGAQATVLPLDPTAGDTCEAYISKKQVVYIVPVTEKSKLKEIHEQFKAAASGIELPKANPLELKELEKKLKGQNQGGSGGSGLIL